MLKPSTSGLSCYTRITFQLRDILFTSKAILKSRVLLDNSRFFGIALYGEKARRFETDLHNTLHLLNGFLLNFCYDSCC